MNFFHGKDHWESSKTAVGKKESAWRFLVKKLRTIEDEMMKLIKTIVYGLDCNSLLGKRIMKNTDECVSKVEETVFDIKMEVND